MTFVPINKVRITGKLDNFKQDALDSGGYMDEYGCLIIDPTTTCLSMKDKVKILQIIVRAKEMGCCVVEDF